MSASTQKAAVSSLLCLRETESDSGSATWYKPFISVYETEAPEQDCLQRGLHMRPVLLAVTLRRRRRHSLGSSQRRRNQDMILSYPAVTSWGKCCLVCLMHMTSTTREEKCPWEPAAALRGTLYVALSALSWPGRCMFNPGGCLGIDLLHAFRIHCPSLNYPAAQLRWLYQVTQWPSSVQQPRKHKTWILGTFNPMEAWVPSSLSLEECPKHQAVHIWGGNAPHDSWSWAVVHLRMEGPRHQQKAAVTRSPERSAYAKMRSLAPILEHFICFKSTEFQIS